MSELDRMQATARAVGLTLNVYVWVSEAAFKRWAEKDDPDYGWMHASGACSKLRGAGRIRMHCAFTVRLENPCQSCRWPGWK